MKIDLITSSKGTDKRETLYNSFAERCNMLLEYSTVRNDPILKEC